MKEFALALSALTASNHGWPMKPPPEPAAIERPAPVQTRYVDLRELRKAIDRYCREQRRVNESARRSRVPMFDPPNAAWPPPLPCVLHSKDEVSENQASFCA